MSPSFAAASQQPLIGIDITARDDCFRGIRIALRARQQELGSCRLRYLGHQAPAQHSQESLFAPCDGIIAFAASHEREAELAQLDIPILNVSARLVESRFPRVLADHRAMGRLAAEALRARGLRRVITWDAPLGYVHWRCQGVQEALADQPVELHCLSSLKDVAAELIPRLAVPFGIIGSNDQQAGKMIAYVRAQGYHIPEQVSVIGMDNDSQICETCEVPITSVAIDTLRWGATALDTMLAMLTGRHRGNQITWIPPLPIVERDSVIPPAVAGTTHARLLELLEQERALRMSIEDLALHLGVSKATVVRHCRQGLGSTPHQIVHQARLRRAEQLLLTTKDTVAAIAARCGWRSPARLVVAFQRQHGMSPSAYRNLRRNRTTH